MPDVKMESWKIRREQWQRARHDAKVGKGAVGSVSIGDDLDGVYNAAKKGYSSLIKAVEKAEKDIATYKTKGGKTVQPVATYLGTLTADLATVKKGAESDAQVLKQAWEYLRKFHSLYHPGVPSAEDWIAIERVMKSVDGKPGLDWPAAVKDRDFWYQMPGTLKAYGKTVQLLRGGVKFKVELRGKQAAYAGVLGQHVKYADTMAVIQQYTKVKDAEQYHHWRRQVSDTGGNLGYVAQEMGPHIKSLLG